VQKFIRFSFLRHRVLALLILKMHWQTLMGFSLKMFSFFPLIALEKTPESSSPTFRLFPEDGKQATSKPDVCQSSALLQKTKGVKRSSHEFFIEILRCSVEVILSRKPVNKAKRAKNLSARKKLQKLLLLFLFITFFPCVSQSPILLFFLTEKGKKKKSHFEQRVFGEEEGKKKAKAEK
jgi:hypothetical protein